MSATYTRAQTLIEVLVETSNMLEKYRDDKSVSKDDVLDSMEERLSVIIGKLVALPTSTSFALFRTNAD